MHAAHNLLNDTMAIVFSDDVVEQFDERAVMKGKEIMMELAQADAVNTSLGELSVERLKDWEVGF